MSEEITLAPNPLFVPTRTGLVITGNPSVQEWSEFGKKIRTVEGAVQWLIGDWLNYGETKYGEKYKPAIEATGYDYQTLANEKQVSRRFQISRRREDLSWSHHAEVAGVDDDIGDKLLQQAETEQLTVKELRGIVRNIKAIKDTKRIEPGPLVQVEGAVQIEPDVKAKDTIKKLTGDSLVASIFQKERKLTITVPYKVFAALAKYEQRPDSDSNHLIATLLAGWLKEHGFLPKNYETPTAK
jgi:hypothetical protein